MVKIRLLYTYRNKNNGNVIRIHSKLTSPDWEPVTDHDKEIDTTQTETAQGSTEEATQKAPEESETDTSPAEKPAEASVAAKKKATTAAKKSTGKKV